MKDKEKQIEEMEFDLTMIVQRDYYGHILFKETAEKLIKQGWIKPPKDSVVLSREEFDEKIDREVLKRTYQEFDGIYRMASKETAEKILNDIMFCIDINNCNKNEMLILSACKMLAKQFGVEIKE